jgi:hypothetical protein
MEGRNLSVIATQLDGHQMARILPLAREGKPVCSCGACIQFVPRQLYETDLEQHCTFVLLQRVAFHHAGCGCGFDLSDVQLLTSSVSRVLGLCGRSFRDKCAFSVRFKDIICPS